ncbi:hypothetical protein GMSM_03990 [Geomonas sp. Red276]
MPSFSLKIKMTLAVVLFGAVVSTVSGVGLLLFTREFKKSVAEQQFSLVSTMAGELDDKILAAQRELSAVARSIPPAAFNDPQAMQRFLDGRLDAQQVFADGVGFFSAKGILTASSPGQSPLVGMDFSSRDFFRQTVASGKEYISEPFRSQSGAGHPVVVFTAPVFTAGGKVAGVVGGRLDLLEENFLGRLSRLKVGKSGNFFLFNSQRQLIVQRDRDRQARGEMLARNNDLLPRAIAGFEGSGEAVSHNGEEVLYTFKKLATTGWILGTRVPMAEAYAPVERARSLVLWSLGVALPASLLLVWLFLHRLTAPLALLARRVAETGGSETGFRPVVVQTRDEIGMLAGVFNEVMTELAERRRLLEREKGFAEGLVHHTAVPCFVIDGRHRVIIWNRACEELTGMPAAEVIGGSDPWKVFYPSPRPVLADVVVDGSLNEMADLYEYYADSPHVHEGLHAEGWYKLRGRSRYLTFDAAPIRDADGCIVAAIQTLQDVTLRATNEEQLRGMVAAIGESEERFRRLVELSLDGIAILVGRRFEFINPAGAEMLGFVSPDELTGREMREFIQRDSAELFQEQLGYTEESGANAPWIEERLLRKDGTAVEVEIGVSPFVHQGSPALQVIFRDITERKLAKARLETLAHYDSLTSLPNRVLFFDRLRHAVTEAKRFQHPMALMYLDLDRFKEINDTLGHAAGDAVLVETGRRLKECVRGCDMVARMGGDEFTVILGKLADELDAAVVAERIIHSLSVPFNVEGTLATIGVSIGICIFPTYGGDMDQMTRKADLALYQSKEQGRNRYCFYSDEMDQGRVATQP